MFFLRKGLKIAENSKKSAVFGQNRADLGCFGGILGLNGGFAAGYGPYVGKYGFGLRFGFLAGFGAQNLGLRGQITRAAGRFFFLGLRNYNLA